MCSNVCTLYIVPTFDVNAEVRFSAKTDGFVGMQMEAVHHNECFVSYIISFFNLE